MELNKYMFREYDIRGIYGKDINPEISYLIGKAFGSKLIRLGKNITIVGYDNRKSSPIIEENLVKGIRECGVDVVRLGLVTTPMYYYSWDLLDIHSGMMITASHNPKDDNGFKFSYNGIHNAFGKSTLELYDIIMNNDFVSSDKIGNVKDVDIKKDYIKMIVSGINLGNNKIKVVYDCGNGTTCVVADEIFNYFEEVCINSDDYLNNVFSITTLEILGNEKNILEIAKKYMGPVTIKLQREADLAIGRKV